MPRRRAAAAKKKETVQPLEEEEDNDEEVQVFFEQKWPTGTRVHKEFHVGWFYGEVKTFNAETGYYFVEYEDGDSEEMDPDEMKQFVVMEGEEEDSGASTKTASTRRKKGSKNVKGDNKDDNKDDDNNKPGRKKRKTARGRAVAASPDDDEEKKESDDDSVVEIVVSRRGRQRKAVVSYKMDDSSSSEEDDDDEGDDNDNATSGQPKKRTIATSGNKSTKATKRRKTKNDDDESDFEQNDNANDESDDEIEVDTESEIEVEDETDEEESSRRGKKRGRRGKKESTVAKKKATTSGGGANGKKEKKSMAESFQPMSTPVYGDKSLEEIYNEMEYLDPCGMEATDDVIDHLVGEQVLKIGKLLQRTLENEQYMGSSSSNPLQLGTACSGTDAPALALTIVQEQMERFGLKDKTPLHYQHQFSCENEPFKQSYLARNFDSILYPDIVKLSDDKPKDVYGRETPIPPFNLFVAGTSCKNFSLLHSTKRLDIEDKGCSGETFLSAVELLFLKQPDFCIFENVIGAPWLKMQEYVTGRVKLSTINDTAKAIQKTSAKDAKVKKLLFQTEKNGSSVTIRVTEVPMQVGVRCGSAVKGFSVPGSKSLIPAKAPSGSGKTFTLPELFKANPGVSEKTATIVFETGQCTYCTCIQKVDTKKFGLPQTRQRTYMFVWKPDDPDDFDDDLGTYWQAVVKYLEKPVRHSLDAFILDTDHDNIRVFREALNGPPGRHSKRSCFQEIDFFTSGNGNVPHNKIARQKSGIKEMARPNIQGGERGKKQIPPHYWLEYLDICYQRELDMLDILHIAAARDAESHDSNFSSFFWNISQNVSKEKHRTATPGIAGCISPGGEFFVSNLGRPLLGCEKLLLQGIPYFRLALGSETEVQLGDLAGNAMSLTVVCATMLAAITCHQLRSECPKAKNIDAILAFLEKKGGTKQPMNVNLPALAPTFQSACDASTAFKNLSDLASDAVKSSVWCTSETSGRNAAGTFMHCPTCRISCSTDCLGSISGYQLASHCVEVVKLGADEHHNGNFVSKLRNVAPSSLYFDKESMESLACVNEHDIHRVGDLWKLVFNLQKIHRARRKWLLHYNARDNNGVGEVVAEFRITIGEIWTESKKDNSQIELGMKGELVSYVPAKTVPLVPGKLEPCAIVLVPEGSDGECQWQARQEPTEVSLEVVGSESSESLRVELGLTDEAPKNLKEATERSLQKKRFQEAKSRGEERRWLYPDNWKEWPTTIDITSEEYHDINGQYTRAPCRQTVNQSALWIRSGDPPAKALYLIIKPNIGRTGPDCAVISKSISADDFSAILVTLPKTWQPSDALLPEHHLLNGEKSMWKKPPSMQCFVPNSSIKVETENPLPTLLAVSGLSQVQTNMLFPFESKSDDLEQINLNVHSGVESQKIIRAFNNLCAPPILQQIAKSEKLASQLSPGASWTTMTRSAGEPIFGFCERTIPSRPLEHWEYDEERETFVRMSIPEESRRYYRKLQEAPKAFKFMLNKTVGRLEMSYFPEVAAHHAARFLLEGRGDSAQMEEGLEVTYRLSDISRQSDPEYSPFRVFPCVSEMPTEVGLNNGYELYERQQKVVTKMSLIEQKKVDYEELEMSEHEMPGSTGLSIIAKAARNRKISGGVIADAIGAGKTVISIALILQGLDEARASRVFPRQSGASLVVVPSALVLQWKNECEKFTTGLKVVCINDTKGLQKTTVQQIVEADVVICPVDIIESKGYTANLTTKSGLVKSKDHDKSKIPDLPKSMGQQEKPGASGVWVPAAAADPYGRGASNEMKSQKLRDISAFFTYSYLKSIQLLRGKEFKKTDKGVPLEYFSWERIVVDEIHECLCTEKDNLQLDWFKEKNRRASRELLGITQKDVTQRPLVYRKSIFGLTGTPLLDNSSRVIELANLIGCTYVIGLASHWRKLERESRRDIFLQHFLEPKQSREIRKAIYSKCQEYLTTACCRNTAEKELEGIEKVEESYPISMSEEEEELYVKSQHGIDRSIRSLAIRPEQFDPSAGHDISVFLRQNSEMPSRGKALVTLCQTILSSDKTTKIIVFTDGRIGGGIAARTFLEESGLGCTSLDVEDSVETQNEKISFYQRSDATEEDRARPRVLVLHFDHAAGLNLQKECHNMILFNPLYVGDGGTTSDPVADASTEQQAIGRVFRPGQLHPEVFVYRIEVRGPNGEECLDGYVIRRNTDPDTLAATTNAGEA